MRRLSTAIATAACAALLLTGCGDAATETPDQAAATQSGSGASSAPEATPSPTEPPELIGGGTELFPDRRFVALYGHPGTPGLGVLGEQGPEESAQRAIELAKQYGRYGYRRVTALLHAAGWSVNHKRVERIWRREGLKVPQRQPQSGWPSSLPRTTCPRRP